MEEERGELEFWKFCLRDRIEEAADQVENIRTW